MRSLVGSVRVYAVEISVKTCVEICHLYTQLENISQRLFIKTRVYTQQYGRLSNAFSTTFSVVSKLLNGGFSAASTPPTSTTTIYINYYCS